MAETRRVVIATGEVREVDVRAFEYQGRHICWTANRHATGESKGAAVVQWARNLSLDVREILAPGEPTRAELVAQLATVTAERDVLRAQQAPLLDAHDALVAAARAAGWTGAGATGAELVAWVRRGEREACAALLETAADEREYAAGRSDDDVDHHDLCTRAKHLRGAAALLRLNTTWLPAKAVREGGE